MESFEDFDLKIISYICLNENLKMSSIKGQGHNLTFDPELLHVDNIKHIF